MFYLFTFPKELVNTSFDLKVSESYDSEHSATQAFHLRISGAYVPGYSLPFSQETKRRYNSDVSITVVEDHISFFFNSESKSGGKILELYHSVKGPVANVVFYGLIVSESIIQANKIKQKEYYLIELGEEESAEDVPISCLRIYPSKEAGLEAFYQIMISVFKQYEDGYVPKSVSEISCQPSIRTFGYNLKNSTFHVSERKSSQTSSSNCFDLHYGVSGGLHLDLEACLISADISWN